MNRIQKEYEDNSKDLIINSLAPLSTKPYLIAYNLEDDLILLDWMTNLKTIENFNNKIILSIKICDVKNLAVNLEDGSVRIYNY